ncbi:hypothetical protein BO78DRAFT_463113 [Aspergillus sclerotiicarbonarius CBS 121057]|uniref:Uncharacterized protein n=1 Tax=Aspergillus sclerotiicarbonarius (strain CBS 121057 / IBT 28362) TaxID=1448318 RepID=A0A319E102_ASPSB|nr:hypothetical protein BO78DRAFT_463113 [Aspergillus sclerotiicarbonarius CBS 121057]
MAFNPGLRSSLGLGVANPTEDPRRATNIFRDWALLNRIMERLEGTVRKRWLKRTGEQRKHLLLSAWPNMPPTHRPDIEAFRREPPGNPKYREDYMWPHINLEDLLNPKLLLIFLNARGRHPPHAFIQADWASVDFGRATAGIMRALMKGHVMVFAGHTTPETYGEFIQCDDQRAFDLDPGREMNPGDGLLSLEIQERLYRFLVDCCMQLLPEYTREGLLQADLPIQPEPPAISTSEAGLDLLSVVAAEAPYRLPASLDIDRLHCIVAAKQAAAEDHIWALREDPGYFAQALLDRKEQALEPCHRLMTKHAAVLRLENDLPRALEWRFMKLIWLLERMARGPIINLQAGFPPSPPVRAFFLRAPPLGGHDHVRTMSKESWVADKKRNRLSWIMTTLWDEEERPLAGLTNLMDELQRMIENDKYVRELLTPWVMENISDLSVLSLCLQQILSFQPWAAIFPNLVRMNEDVILDDYMRHVDQWNCPAFLFLNCTMTLSSVPSVQSQRMTKGLFEKRSRPVGLVREPMPSHPANHGPDVQPTFTVDRRAYKVFTTLFYVPSRTSQPGEVPWTDFLHAMASTGFSMEKLYGSVWQFTPQRLDVERGIQFHEPHPSGKIPFRTARRHGRRLFRAYGWHSGMFQLES